MRGLAPFTMPFSGQICFAQTRIVAPRSRMAEVVDTYAEIVKGLTMGDPWDPATQVGPVLVFENRPGLLFTTVASMISRAFRGSSARKCRAPKNPYHYSPSQQL